MMKFIENLFDFNKFIAPVYIKIVFWVLLICVSLYSVGSILEGFYMITHDQSSGLDPLFQGIIALAIGPLSLRLTADYLLVTFEIHKQLTQINAKLKCSTIPSSDDLNNNL